MDPMAQSLRSAWRTWPGLEPVTLRSITAPGTYADYRLEGAKPRPLTFKEIAPSGGVYKSSDRKWLVPDELLAAAVSGGVSPKPADQVVDQAGGTWTVLEATRQALGNTWALITRNLVLEYGLRDACDVLRPASTQDAAGFRVPGLATVYTAVPCKLQEQGAGLEASFDAQAQRREFDLYVGQRLYLTAQDVVRVGADSYDLVGTGDWDRLDLLGVVRVRKTEA